VYAELKVPEVWRWMDKTDGKYSYRCSLCESETSLAFESFPAPELARFMQLSQIGENARLREFREWVRQKILAEI